MPVASNSYLVSFPPEDTSADSPVQSSLVQVIQTHSQVLVQHEETWWGGKEPELSVTQFQGAPFTLSFSANKLELAISSHFFVLSAQM